MLLQQSRKQKLKMEVVMAGVRVKEKMYMGRALGMLVVKRFQDSYMGMWVVMPWACGW